MKTITKLGLGLLVVGAAVLVTSSGAFDSLSADRGIGVETAPDADAYVGLEYPEADQARTIRLESSTADSGGFCVLYSCDPYRYDDVDVVVITDQTASGNLVVEDLTVVSTGDDVTAAINEEYGENSLRVVRGDFECQVDPVFLGYGTQQAATATLTISLEASDGSFSTTLEREVTVECVPD